MTRLVVSVVIGFLVLWIAYTILYGCVFAFTGDIHNGWATVVCLAISL